MVRYKKYLHTNLFLHPQSILSLFMYYFFFFFFKRFTGIIIELCDQKDRQISLSNEILFILFFFFFFCLLQLRFETF